MRLSTNYTFISNQEEGAFVGREALTTSASSQINQFWRASFSANQDLVAKELRSLSFGVTYEDECVIINTTASRSFFVDRDIEPTDAVFVRLTLKTLGAFETSASSAE